MRDSQACTLNNDSTIADSRHFTRIYLPKCRAWKRSTSAHLGGIDERECAPLDLHTLRDIPAVEHVPRGEPCTAVPGVSGRRAPRALRQEPFARSAAFRPRNTCPKECLHSAASSQGLSCTGYDCPSNSIRISSKSATPFCGMPLQLCKSFACLNRDSWTV